MLSNSYCKQVYDCIPKKYTIPSVTGITSHPTIRFAKLWTDAKTHPHTWTDLVFLVRNTTTFDSLRFVRTKKNINAFCLRYPEAFQERCQVRDSHSQPFVQSSLKIQSGSAVSEVWSVLVRNSFRTETHYVGAVSVTVRLPARQLSRLFHSLLYFSSFFLYFLLSCRLLFPPESLYAQSIAAENATCQIHGGRGKRLRRMLTLKGQGGLHVYQLLRHEDPKNSSHAVYLCVYALLSQ